MCRLLAVQCVWLGAGQADDILPIFFRATTQAPPARTDLKRPEQVASETGQRDVSSQKIGFEIILSFFGTSQHLKTQAVLSVLKIWPILIFLKSS